MQIGLWFAINSHLLRDSVIDTIKTIIKGNSDVEHTQMAIWSSVIFAMGILIQVFNYEGSTQSEIPVVWVTNQINGCGVKSVDDAFQSRALSEFGGVSLAFGAFFGLLLQHWQNPKLIASGPQNDSNWRVAGRFGMTVLLSTPWVALQVIFEATKSAAYVLFFCKTLIPVFFIGLTMFYLADLVNMKVGLLETAETVAKSSFEKPQKAEEEASLLQGDQEIAVEDGNESYHRE